jgi:hypothetical protein
MSASPPSTKISTAVLAKPVATIFLLGSRVVGVGSSFKLNLKP